MIDEQDTKFPVEENLPEEQDKAEEMAAEMPAAEEIAAEEKTGENTAVEDGFSEMPSEPVKAYAEQPDIPQDMAAAEQTPTCPAEEPAEPVNVEGGQPAFQQEVPESQAPQQEIPQQEIPWQAPYSVPDGYPNGYAQQSGYGAYPGYPQQYPPQPPFQPQVPFQPQNQPPYPPQYYGYPQQQGIPQGISAAGQQGYYGQQPGYGQPGYPVYGAAPARPPKKKMSTGLKVFIWIASILAAAAILGFGAYLAYHAASMPGSGNDFGGRFPSGPSVPRLPGEDRDDRDDWNDGEGDGIPDFDDGVIPPDEGDPTPDVDVTPNTEGITIHKQPEGEELSAQEVYQKVVKSTVTVAVTYNGSNSTGTGIIATSDGYIITNSHVVMNSKSSVVEITAYDGQQYEAVVVGVDRTTDLAILKTNDYDFTPAEFGDSGELAIGDSVVAIGNPGGAKFSGSMTGGYISGLDRAVGSYSENGMTYIQTDAAINPGNSGGPLVNMYGQVVGINSSKIVSDGYEGMGFAIPVSKAQSIINELLSGGYVKGRTRLGITGADVTSSMAMFYGMPQGFVIYEIPEDSAFTGTEAREGDVIIAIDGETVTGLTDISNLLLRHAPGDKATVTLYRQDGTELEVTITLLEDKGETQK